MRFRDIIGHKEIRQKLIRVIQDQRVSHAQLFTGPEGCGKLAMAIAYAQYVNCQDKQEDDSCGICSSCLKFEKLVHPDLHFMYPVATTKEITGKPISINFIKQWRSFLFSNNYYVGLNDWYEAIEIEKKQGSINVYDCNDLLKTLSYTTYEAEYKVMIIWMVEKLHHAAAPKLLKILEEPPDKTLFILVSEKPEQIMSTIISRTQIVRIPKIANDEMEDYIGRTTSLTPAESQKICSLSEGNYLDARRILKGDDDVSHFQFFRQWMRSCYSVNLREIKKTTDEFAVMGRERQKQFFSFSLKIIRDCLLSHFKNDRILILEGEELEFINKFSPYIHHGNGAEFSEKLNSSYSQIERNANPSILFLNLSLKFAGLLRVPKPTDI